MGWSIEGEQTAKKGMETPTKILLAIIGCIILIIVLIGVLLVNIQQSTYTISVDGKIVNTINKNNLVAIIDDITYINIEEFSKIVSYEYHQGEYKEFTIAENKCYVQGANETASFFLNENRVSKLPVNDLTSEYKEFVVDNPIKDVNGKMYAPIDAIKVAFNVQVSETKDSLTILTLNYLVDYYNKETIKWGYTGISDQNFENQKSVLYGYLIVKKENGLYKITDNKNNKEIVSDKYTSVQFTEDTKEFFVTNSLGQVGIINLDGTTKIEPIYESISILDKQADLYLIQKDKKYGVVKSGNISIIYPEFDSIGLDTKNITASIENKYLILDTLIPVCKENKWGAYDKKGNLIYNVEYDSFAFNSTTVEINQIKKEVKPVLFIEQCKGIVVKKDEKYGLLEITGKELVPLEVDGIYTLENEDTNYYMLYKGRELNIIERLIAVGLMETNKNNNETLSNNTITQNEVSNKFTNTISNNVTQ